MSKRAASSTSAEPSAKPAKTGCHREDQKGDSQCPINSQLSGDLLGRVFRLLPWEQRVRAERVCRRWRALLLEQGWTHLRAFDTGCGQMGDRELKRACAVVTRCGPNLQQLTIRWRSRSNPRSTCALVRLCSSSLHHLRLEEVECTATVMKCVRETVGPQLWSLAVSVHPKKVGGPAQHEPPVSGFLLENVIF
jgi:hypothetical protein